MKDEERTVRAAAIWRTLRDLRIGDDFVGRLVKTNGWTRERAMAADREYRRFLLIASLAPNAVPSRDVDQVWHEHILHTRSYQDMCSAIGVALHHDPSAGGDADEERLARGYRETLDLYERIFAGPPPEEFWPDGRRRRMGPLGRLISRLAGRTEKTGQDVADSTTWPGADVAAATGVQGHHANGGAPDHAPDGHGQHAATGHGDAGHADAGHAPCGHSSCGGGD